VPEFSKDFDVRVLELFNENKNHYEKVGIKNVEQLFDKENFKSLYDVKFKAFQGYTVFLHGKTSSGVGCGTILKPLDPKPAATKQ
jgi:ABC-type ATPase involved in cell division